MAGLNPGAQRDRITVQSRAIERNGGVVRNVFTARTPERLPAEVTSAEARQMERVFGQQVQAVATHLVRMRTWREVRLTDRVIWHERPDTDRVLEVRALGYPPDDPLRQSMLLACEERDAR